MVFTIILSFFAISLQAQTDTKTLKIFAPPVGNAGGDSVLLWHRGDSAVYAISPSKLPVAGDVTGTLGNATIAKLQGKPLSAATPANGYILVYNNATGSWEATAPAAAPTDNNTTYALTSTAPTVTTGGTITLTPSTGTAVTVRTADADSIIGNEVTNTADASLVRT